MRRDVGNVTGSKGRCRLHQWSHLVATSGHTTAPVGQLVAPIRYVPPSTLMVVIDDRSTGDDSGEATTTVSRSDADDKNKIAESGEVVRFRL